MQSARSPSCFFFVGTAAFIGGAFGAVHPMPFHHFIARNVRIERGAHPGAMMWKGRVGMQPGAMPPGAMQPGSMEPQPFSPAALRADMPATICSGTPHDDRSGDAPHRRDLVCAALAMAPAGDAIVITA